MTSSDFKIKRREQAVEDLKTSLNNLRAVADKLECLSENWFDCKTPDSIKELRIVNAEIDESLYQLRCANENYGN